MKNLLALTIFTTTISGCATGQDPLLKLMSSSERTVVVQALEIGNAQKLADTECRKFGRAAQFASQLPDTVQYVFNCQL